MAATGSRVQVFAVVFVCLGLTTTAPPPQGRLTTAEWQSYHEINHQGPGTYAFGYDVDDAKSGNTQFRQEERFPNGTVRGSYGLVEADGTVRIVHYVADHLGYRAKIETIQKTRNIRPQPSQSLPVAGVTFNQPRTPLPDRSRQEPRWSAVPYFTNYV